eukprot:362837-Chlamydomonas_euryale.AAC.8
MCGDCVSVGGEGPAREAACQWLLALCAHCRLAGWLAGWRAGGRAGWPFPLLPRPAHHGEWATWPAPCVRRHHTWRTHARPQTGSAPAGLGAPPSALLPNPTQAALRAEGFEE